MSRGTPHTARAALAGLACAALLAVGCDDAEPQAQARRIDTRSELIGGPSALGEVGDYLLENNQIRVVVQDKGFSRGFGVYGGGLIDIDRQRAVAPGGPAGGNGRDRFGELFPIAFLQALVPEAVEVVADGADGGAAIVRVSGAGGDFLSLTKALNQAVLNSHDLPDNPLDVFDVDKLVGDPQIGYEIFYELPPDAKYVRLRVRLTNLTDADLPIPSTPGRIALAALGIDTNSFDAPLGFVLLFGAGNKVFSPGFGYDIRFSLDDAYAAGGELPFPALPGLLTNALISTSDSGVSYGFFTLPSGPDEPETLNFAANRVDADGENLYERELGADVGEDTMLVPFLASSFTGVFYAQTPRMLSAGGSTEYSAYMAVGNGDVASVMDTILALRAERGDPTPLVELYGQVEDAETAAPLEGVSVVVYDASDRPLNQFTTDAFGRIRGTLPAGAYTARVERSPIVSAPIPFELKADEAAKFVRLAAPTPGYLSVRVRDDAGRPLPAKVTVVGTTPAERAGEHPRRYLFDLSAGQSWRTSDVIPDDPADPDTRRYIEAVEYTDAAGKVRLGLPPGVDFQVYVSRGIEYGLSRTSVSVAPGETASVVAQLERVVDTTGYISADFHLHAAPSLDSDLDLGARVRSVVGEGVEVLTATDHNFITDYGPTLLEEGLEDWAISMIGLELTTLESGHFNGFPLVRDVGRITRGAFEWSLRPPEELFRELRALGRFGPDETIVQINHPRDTILGYFAQYGLDPLNGGIPEVECGALDFGCAIAPNGPAFRDANGMSTFSYDFDAIEVLNGSVIGQTFHARSPEDPERLRMPASIRQNLPPPGTILCDATVEDDGDLSFDGELAFPGVVDDWFNLLNLGHRYIGTGTSDSHDAADHTGYARSFLKVDDDRPRALDARAVVRALQSRNVLMTNGPFVTIAVGPPGGAAVEMGGEVAAEGGAVEVRVDVQAADWVDIDEGRIWLNGEVVHRFPIEMDGRRFAYSHTLEGLAADAWIVVEVRGDGSMFPIVRPVDIPPVLLGDAFSTLAGPLGLGGSDFGELEPKRVGVFTPMALTNPVWIRADGDATWDAPGALPRCCLPGDEGGGLGVSPVPCGGGMVEKSTGRIPPAEVVGAPRVPRMVESFGFPRLYGDIQDVRTIFEQFGRHAH